MQPFCGILSFLLFVLRRQLDKWKWWKWVRNVSVAKYVFTFVLWCSRKEGLQIEDFNCISVLGRGHFGKVCISNCILTLVLHCTKTVKMSVAAFWAEQNTRLEIKVKRCLGWAWPRSFPSQSPAWHPPSLLSSFPVSFHLDSRIKAEFFKRDVKVNMHQFLLYILDQGAARRV